MADEAGREFEANWTEEGDIHPVGPETSTGLASLSSAERLKLGEVLVELTGRDVELSQQTSETRLTMPKGIMRLIRREEAQAAQATLEWIRAERLRVRDHTLYARRVFIGSLSFSLFLKRYELSQEFEIEG